MLNAAAHSAVGGDSTGFFINKCGRTVANRYDPYARTEKIQPRFKTAFSRIICTRKTNAMEAKEKVGRQVRIWMNKHYSDRNDYDKTAEDVQETWTG